MREIHREENIAREGIESRENQRTELDTSARGESQRRNIYPDGSYEITEER